MILTNQKSMDRIIKVLGIASIIAMCCSLALGLVTENFQFWAYGFSVFIVLFGLYFSAIMWNI